MCKKTPLYDVHVASGGKIVPFAGYYLPVQYASGVIKEHMAVRTACGLFDVSHLGEIFFEGADALSTLNHLLCNDMCGMADGQVRYSPMCNEQGGVVDDLVVCRMGEDKYMAVINASNRDKDVAWMGAHLLGDTVMTDLSDQYAQLALQGPKAPEILAKLCEDASIPKKYYWFTESALVGGIPCLISRTGYTGELGYELYCAPQDAEKLWKLLLEAGAEYGLIPCGLGARDTLRLEAGMPLYGHEMTDDITPLEAGLGFFVKMEKPDFIGKAALQEKGAPTRIRVGYAVTGRGIVREHCDVYADGKLIGHTTSGTHCPYIGKPVAMALVSIDSPPSVQADVRGRMIDMEITPLPFYKRSK